MTTIQNPITGDSLETEPENTPVEETTEETSGEDQTQETAESTQTPPAPSQLDPLAELEKLEQLDPKVKEALKAGYLRQADYTKKTQALAGDRSAVEAYQKWSPIISYLEKNPDVAKTLFATNKPPTETQEEPQIPDDPKEFAKYIEERSIKRMTELFAQEREQQARERQTDAQIAESEKLDTRLTTDETFAKQIAGLIEVNYGEAIRGGQMNIVEATQKALEAHKAYEESQRQKFLAELNGKAKKTMSIPSGKGSPLGTAPKKGKVSMAEAAALAEEEIASR